MDDLINRQAALETIRTMQTYKLFAGDDMLLIDQAEAQTELMMLPSIQPEQRWIPVTEGLPEIDKEVLVTDGELCRGCSLFEPQDNEDGLYQWEDNYGHWYEFETWVAWMPLPEYYREEG